MLNKMYCIIMWISMEISLLLIMLLGVILLVLVIPSLWVGSILRRFGFGNADDWITNIIEWLGQWYSNVADMYGSMGTACQEDISERWNS